MSEKGKGLRVFCDGLTVKVADKKVKDGTFEQYFWNSVYSSIIQKKVDKVRSNSEDKQKDFWDTLYFT